MTATGEWLVVEPAFGVEARAHFYAGGMLPEPVCGRLAPVVGFVWLTRRELPAGFAWEPAGGSRHCGHCARWLAKREAP